VNGKTEHPVFVRVAVSIALAGALAALGLLACVPPAPHVLPEEPGLEAGRIHGVNVLSDKVEDVSSLEAILANIDADASPGEKAERLFLLTAKFRHQAQPADEYVEDWHVHDPVKIFNVYGYCQCCCASAALMALGRACGLRTRGRNLTGHSVPEIFYEDRWHMYDAALINFFVTDDGHVASVDELAAQGAALINREHSRFIDANGWYPARTHRADPDGLREYSSLENTSYEWPYSLGHRVGLTLRRGEAVVRNWSNKGLFLDQDESVPYQPSLTATGPVGNQVYLERLYPGYQAGLVGNGVLEYIPDLASGSYRGGILSESGVACTADDGRAPAVHLAASGAGEIVIPFWSSYVFLDGKMKARLFRATGEDRIDVSLSLNNGLDWERIWSDSGLGSHEVEIDLKPYLYRRYRYLVKIRLESPSAKGRVGIESLAFTHDIQHSQRPLPLLMKGPNRITVTAPSPRIATRTLEGSLSGHEDRNASYRDFHPELANIRTGDWLSLAGGNRGTVTFPVEAHGDIRAVRFGGSFRCRSEEGSIRLLISDTDGASWKVAGTIPGPFVGRARYLSFDRIAEGTRRVLVRYELNGPGAVAMFVFRVDVDYEDPLAGPRPVRVTYRWTEDGAERSNSVVVTDYPTSWSIDLPSVPIMRSIRVEGI